MGGNNGGAGVPPAHKGPPAFAYCPESLRRFCYTALAAVLLTPTPAPAQEPADPPLFDGRNVPAAMANADGRCSLGASTLVGLAAANPARAVSCLAALRVGEEKLCWTLVDTSQVRPFPDAWRDWVHDNTPIRNDPQEVAAYAGTLLLARSTDTAALDKAARRDLTFVQLFREPAKYRGQVVRIGGRLKRVRRYDDPPEAAREGGVDCLYEGWLFNDDFGANPVCCVFTDLPDGLRVAEKMEERVEFAGYYFKRYRYKAGDTPKAAEWREAPLLVGRFVSVRPQAGDAAAPEQWGKPLLPIMLSVVGVTLVSVIVLTLWMRRSDDRVRRRVTAAIRQPFDPEGPPPGPPAASEPTP